MNAKYIQAKSMEIHLRLLSRNIIPHSQTPTIFIRLGVATGFNSTYLLQAMQKTSLTINNHLSHFILVQVRAIREFCDFDIPTPTALAEPGNPVPSPGTLTFTVIAINFNTSHSRITPFISDRRGHYFFNPVPHRVLQVVINYGNVRNRGLLVTCPKVMGGEIIWLKKRE